MNWLDRARREIEESCREPTVNSAKRNPTAVTAVPNLAPWKKLRASIGSNGSTPLGRMLECEALREDFEERAAIMQFDGDLSRDEAERAAWALVSKRYRLN